MLKLLLHYIYRHRKSFVFSAACICISLFLMFLSRTVEGFAQWYSTAIYPMFPNTFGRMFSLLPFSVFETGIVLVIIALLLWTAKLIFLLAVRSPRRGTFFAHGLRRGLILLSVLLLLFTMAGSINYSKDKFADIAGMAIQKYTREDLNRLALLLIEDLTELEDKIDLDHSGYYSIDKTKIHDETVSAVRNLGERYAPLNGYYPRPKPVYFSRIMSQLGITGIFSPFTMEANYNRDVADFVIPYTISHELAHVKGFMREDEANFIAYLACRDSSSPSIQYSGAVNALIYTLNALHDNVSREEYASVYQKIPEQVKRDLNQNSVYWKQHTSTVTTIAKAANDQYLMANAQEEGLQSYGRMVDLLLAEYAEYLKDSVLL